MTIRITARAGVGAWAPGAVIALDDHHAQRLIRTGYAERVTDPTETKKAQWPSKAKSKP